MAAARDDLGPLKARVRLSSVIGRTLKLTRQSGEHVAPCPFHGEKTPSFTVSDAKGFYHCFGCGAHGDVLDWWQAIDGLSLPEAIDRLKAEAGHAPPWREEARSSKADDAEARAKREQARAIWQASQPIAGTIGEVYLRQARRIRAALPESLRFHPSLPSGGPESLEWPAMVAAVTNLAGEVIAIQRTFLATDGSGKAAISGPKRSLGSLAEGAVQLRPAASTLGIAEGVETGLSAMEAFLVPVWCALGSNLARIALPAVVQNVAIFADHGEAGEAAAEKARQHFRQLGRRVAVKLPPEGHKDWNDWLRARRNG
jgi:DNA primase